MFSQQVSQQVWQFAGRFSALPVGQFGILPDSLLACLIVSLPSCLFAGQLTRLPVGLLARLSSLRACWRVVGLGLGVKGVIPVGVAWAIVAAWAA